MNREVVTSLQAPSAIGPYSQAVAVTATRTVYLSGQIPLDPQTGQLVDGDVGRQTTQVMENLKAVLEAAGLELKHVVRCTIFLIEMGDFAKVNEVYGTYFPSAPPARATVAVAALPKGARVEIDAVAAA